MLATRSSNLYHKRMFTKCTPFCLFAFSPFRPCPPFSVRFRIEAPLSLHVTYVVRAIRTTQAKDNKNHHTKSPHSTTIPPTHQSTWVALERRPSKSPQRSLSSATIPN